MIKEDPEGHREVPSQDMVPSQKNQPIIFSDFDGFFEAEPTPESTPTLKQISLSVSKGELLGITGKVGSGKSALLSAVLQ